MALLSPNFVFAFREMPLVWKSCIFNVSIHIVLILTHSWFISDVWFHTYILSLLHLRRNVDKCRGCFDSIEHQFPSGRWSCLPWSLPRAGSGHVAWSRDLSPLETRDTWPDPSSDINSVIALQRKYLLILHYEAEFPILHQWTPLIQWEFILYDEEYLIFEDYLCESQETLF